MQLLHPNQSLLDIVDGIREVETEHTQWMASDQMRWYNKLAEGQRRSPVTFDTTQSIIFPAIICLIFSSKKGITKNENTELFPP